MDRFASWLEDLGYWTAPSFVPSYGPDGCQLIPEALVNGRYHVTDRWTCRDEAPPDVRRLFCVRESEAPGWADDWPPRCEAL